MHKGYPSTTSLSRATSGASSEIQDFTSGKEKLLQNNNADLLNKKRKVAGDAAVQPLFDPQAVDGNVAGMAGIIQKIVDVEITASKTITEEKLVKFTASCENLDKLANVKEDEKKSTIVSDDHSIATTASSFRGRRASTTPRRVIDISEIPDPKRLGFVTLSTDITGAQAVQHMLSNFPNCVGVGCSTAFGSSYNQDNFDQALHKLPSSVDSLHPYDAPLDVIGTIGTSWSFACGVPAIRNQLKNSVPSSTKVCDMATSVFTAARCLNMKNVNLLAAYKSDITNAKLVPMLESNGLSIVDSHCLGFDRDIDVWKVSRCDITLAVKELWEDSPDADGMIICCSVLRVLSAGFIDELEAMIGKPIVTSMQAFMWDMLNTAGETSTISGYGKLFSEPNIHPESVVLPKAVRDKANNHETILSVSTTPSGGDERVSESGESNMETFAANVNIPIF